MRQSFPLLIPSAFHIPCSHIFVQLSHLTHRSLLFVPKILWENL